MYLKLLKESSKEILNSYETPYYVYLSLTNYCNANCRFCDVRNNTKMANAINVKKLIDELASMGTKYIHFTGGGEPFINDEIFDYLDYCTKKNIKIILISNGFALNEEKIKKLSNYNIIAFFFSIDSANSKVHDYLRRLPGLWDKATTNINLVKKYMPNIKVILNHVLNKDNIDDFEKYINMKKTINFDYINPIVIKDCEELFPTKEQIINYNNNIDNYNYLADKINVQFLGDDINFFSKNVSSNGDRNYNENLKCVYPSFCAFIDCPTGDVFPCDCSVHRDRKIYNIGNLLENSFDDIWNSNKRLYLRNILLSGKLDCKLRCDEANCLFNKKYLESRKHL